MNPIYKTILLNVIHCEKVIENLSLDTVRKQLDFYCLGYNVPSANLDELLKTLIRVLGV